ncbi:MAG: alanyl-tRNA editing protein [Acidimicrobiales bacterium]
MSDPVPSATHRLYLEDAYLTATEATVLAVDTGGGRVALDRTVFYATSGGQPHDSGFLGRSPVVEVRSEGEVVWHTLEGGLPGVGEVLHAEIDWPRRHELMRTHTALHILCGVIWNEYGVAVTGGNMEPLLARMDFEFDPLPEGFGAAIEQRVNEEIIEDRPVEIAYLDRSAASVDPDLIRTKANRVPEHVQRVRIVDIVGLDKQADGGTHVRSTREVGQVRVVKTESKGKGNKRVRIALS